MTGERVPDHIDGLYSVRRTDMPRASRTLADAFRHDPVWCRVFEGVTRFADRYRAFWEGGLRYGLAYGGVYAPSRALEGIACWLPGRYADISPLRMLLCGSFLSGLRMGMDAMRKMLPMGEMLERDRRSHMAGREYRYLQTIGVATRHQRSGLGSAMVRALTGRSDRDGTWMYLEAESERMVRFYERLGFRVLQRVQLPEIDLPLWEMERPPGGACRV